MLWDHPPHRAPHSPEPLVVAQAESRLVVAANGLIVASAECASDEGDESALGTIRGDPHPAMATRPQAVLSQNADGLIVRSWGRAIVAPSMCTPAPHQLLQAADQMLRFDAAAREFFDLPVLPTETLLASLDRRLRDAGLSVARESMRSHGQGLGTSTSRAVETANPLSMENTS